MDSKDPIYFNGIDPRTGTYLFAPQSAQELAKTVAGDHAELEGDDADHAAELKSRTIGETFGSLADINDISKCGWAVVFPWVPPDSEAAARQQDIADALKPLLDMRQRQAGKYYRCYRGVDGYRPRESKQKFLSRHGAGPGPSDPERVPYYLLLVASPDEIPFSVQYQLDVQYGVGRINFDTLDEYAAYANSVVAAEEGGLELAREVATFSVANEDDPATTLSSNYLITPLFDKLQTRLPEWKVRRYEPAEATKANLASLLGGGAATPAVLFTASHGAGFAKGDPLQRRHQGALICQDWPGPVRWSRKPIPSDHYFSADDIAETANPHGTIVFNFACYGAGTPQFNDYGQRGQATTREPIADAAFQSALHQRMLSRPRGGVLAAVGHVERAWGCSFVWPGSGGRTGSAAQLAVFEGAMYQLFQGMPIGGALETFNQRYAELSSDLSAELEEIGYGRKYDSLALADMWTANNDARGYAITGDPAVRIPMAAPGAATRRVEVERIVLRTTAVSREPDETAPVEAKPEPATQTTTASTSAPTNNYVGFAQTAGQPLLTEAELTRVFGGDGALVIRTDVTDGPSATSSVALDGSVTTTFAPDTPAELRTLHADILARAQTHRAALLNALAAAAKAKP